MRTGTTTTHASTTAVCSRATVSRRTATVRRAEVAAATFNTTLPLAELGHSACAEPRALETLHVRSARFHSCSRSRSPPLSTSLSLTLFAKPAQLAAATFILTHSFQASPVNKVLPLKEQELVQANNAAISHAKKKLLSRISTLYSLSLSFSLALSLSLPPSLHLPASPSSPSRNRFFFCLTNTAQSTLARQARTKGGTQTNLILVLFHAHTHTHTHTHEHTHTHALLLLSTYDTSSHSDCVHCRGGK